MIDLNIFSITLFIPYQPMISFDNFPETNNSHAKLTPRSNEALKRTGFKMEDLVVQTPEEINSKYGDNIH